MCSSRVRRFPLLLRVYSFIIRYDGNGVARQHFRREVCDAHTHTHTCLALTFILWLGVQTVDVRAQALESLTSPVSVSAVHLGSYEQQRLEDLQGAPWVTDISVSTSFRSQAILRRHKFVIGLASGAKVEARTRGVTQNDDGSLVWVGTVAKSESLTSIVADQSGLLGSIRVNDTTYVFHPLGSSATAIYRPLHDKLPPDHPEAAPHTNTFTAGADKTTGISSGGSVIDILVVYTSAASSGISSLINSAEADLNVIHANSDVESTGNVVHYELISYTESDSLELDLARLIGTSDGYMDAVHSTRDAAGADIVVLIVDYPIYEGEDCGLAGGFGVPPSQAFGVVDKSCMVAPKYSFSHELGYLLGGRHH